MKNTNRKKLTLLQVIIFNTFIFLVILIILFSKIIPNIFFYEEEKKSLSKIRDELSLVNQKGISYKQFIEIMNKKPVQDAYLEALIKNISEEFYLKNILNTSKNVLYEDFIKNKEKDIEKKIKERDVSERQKSIQIILPEYTGNSLTQNLQTLTDFKFINYIESILYSFNLVSSDPIGVSDLIAVDDYVSQEAKNIQQEINPKLFYIPLNISLVGKKTDILDFIHFLENIGSISIKEGKITVFNDEKMNQKLNQKKEEKYNIYENQIFDVETIKIPEYIDSDSSNIRVEDQSFEEFIKNNQGDERLTIDLKLRFYVKGMPDYQIKNFIKTTINKYNSLKKESNALLVEMNKLKADSSADIVTMNQLRSVDFDLKLMEKEIKNIKNLYTKSGTDIEIAYKDAVRINTIFEKFDNLLQKTKKIVNSLETNKK